MKKYAVVVNDYGDMELSQFETKEEARDFFKRALEYMFAQGDVEVGESDCYNLTWEECINSGCAVLNDMHSIDTFELEG